MTEIPLQTILDKLMERMPRPDAELLLAQGLESLGWDVREHYTPEEVAAIGMAISRTMLAHLTRAADPFANQLGRSVGGVLDVLQGQVEGLK